MPERPSSVGAGFAMRTLGCKVNRVESDDLAARLLCAGVPLVDEAVAALVIVNTCTVTGEADAKARKAVRQALAAASAPVVVVTGCLAALDADAIAALSDRVVVESDKSALESLALRVLGHASGADLGSTAVRAGEAFRTRAAVKIEDGCDNFCTYCIVPYARGVPRATPIAEIVADVSALVDAGVREVVLTGINMGRYDDAGADLADVIVAVAATGVQRIRLSSIEPVDITQRLLDVLAATPAVCEHLHIPLQSGDDRVLGAMGRRYTTSEYRAAIEAARDAIAGLAISTDIIAGFPGETDDEHANTLRFVESLGFSRLHVFRYSARAGTPAAAMEQVDPRVRSARAADLRVVGEQAVARHIAARTGTEADVLVETLRDECAIGTTRDYLSVRVSGWTGAVGELVRVTLAAGEDGLEGHPIDADAIQTERAR